ncbi:thioredoxin domain-containing protein [Nibrella saemangeumensis]|uniref:Thioredoxin domain-containing protein n=1 Tax=Nibrella saemangeumensis TaxID=1084526 RepID=A0ABP8MH43_9BACT
MNRLSQESSPYLLQHAHNPVDWYPWGEEALTKAHQEDKPILVSIGYSACHWCHVMERESFENEQIARIMNDHFVCIKVDREERPDVDAIYMEAVHAMGVQGGWPLNVFLMPDARPFYGLTYLPPQQWANLLGSVRSAFNDHRDQLAESAEGFARHLNASEIQLYNLTETDALFTPETLEQLYRKLALKFDTEKGGMNRAPKFPMPSIYTFLLRYYHHTQNESALRQIIVTLNRMALGGIYDQIGGGFARYSVDDMWFAPHFEKMLYDNAQLLTLYSEAYPLTQNPLYRRVVYQTIDFARRELLSPEGGFYSALDADSEGEEGKFYTWTTPELKEILGNDFEWFSDLYHITEEGNWEPGHDGHGRNILHRTVTDEEFARQAGWSMEEMNEMLSVAHARLMSARSPRVRPGLDDKVLCSWNGLMLKGLATAYRIFGEPDFLTLAVQTANFLNGQMTDQHTGQLRHTFKNGKASVTGFLEDYAAVIDGYLALYQASFDEAWLRTADQLTRYVMEHFGDNDESTTELFYFTDSAGEALIARRKEILDNVIPASNSIMAGNLYTLSLLMDRPDYGERADQMLGRIQPLLQQYPGELTNWASLYAMRVRPTAEIAILGPQVQEIRRAIDARFYPNKVLSGTESESRLPLLENRSMTKGQTTIYVCYNRACQLPVTDVEEVWRMLH